MDHHFLQPLYDTMEAFGMDPLNARIVGPFVVLTTFLVVLITALFMKNNKDMQTPNVTFVPFEDVSEYENYQQVADVLLVDCFHRDINCITHHRGSSTDPGLVGDSSTALVLDAMARCHPVLMDKSRVSCNHFDIDGFLSVFAVLHPQFARTYRDLLVETALVGDFREYDPERPHADGALKLCCLINYLERNKYSRPFEDHDSPKWEFFLAFDFRSIVEDIAAGKDECLDHVCESDKWRVEYHRVLKDHAALVDKTVSTIDNHQDTAVCVINTPNPVHYYSSFGLCNSCDVLVTVCDGNRYEVEQRYTGFVNLTSRRTLPRVNLQVLATRLNELEASDKLQWVGNRFVDSGPLLRLEPKDGPNLSKMERYGNPFERPIEASSIPPSEFTETVLGFFKDAYTAVQFPRSLRWTWSQLHECDKMVSKKLSRNRS